MSAEDAATGTIRGRVLNGSNGKYLGNVRVQVEGTSLEAITDDFGNYTLRNVPVGDVTLKADYSGQQSVTAATSVQSGQATVMNLRFGKPAAPGEEETVVLDEFQVETERFKSAQEIAINAERFSVNIKNVVAADSFGDIPSGNIGEFVKFIPGVLTTYGTPGSSQGVSDADATGISIRGFEAADTAILIDGMPVSNAFPGSLSRQVGLDMLSINNASRIEVVKVPTPDMPANSIGGQVNLVTKSAFEYAKPTFNWDVYLTANSEDLDFKKTVGPTNKKTFKTQPSGTFSVAYPLTPNFGFSVTGAFVRTFDENHRAQPTWNQRGSTSLGIPANTPVEAAIPIIRASYVSPWFERVQITDTPRMTTRKSGNIKLDWRPLTGHALSLNFQNSTYDSDEGSRRLDYRAGGWSGTTIPVSWGPDFTTGQISNGTPRVAMTVTTRDKVGETNSGAFTYTIQRGGWDVFAAGSRSVSTGEFKDRANGHFSEVAAIIGGAASGANAAQINFFNVKDGIPGRVQYLSLNGTGPEIDTTKIAGWRGDSLTVKSGEAFSRDTVSLYQVNVRRELDFIPGADRLNLALKVGVRRDEKKAEKWGPGTGYSEELAVGKAAPSMSDLVDNKYVGESPGFDRPPQQWISTYKMYQLEQTQDNFDVHTEATRISNWNSYANQQKSLTETKDAWYAQLEGRMFNNRLSFIGGLRQEENSRVGFGPFTDGKYNFVKNLDGTVYREGTAQTVATPYFNGVNFGSATIPNPGGSGTIPNPFLTNGGGILQRLQSAGLWYPSNPDGTARLLNNTTLEGRMLQLQANRRIDQKAKGDPSYSLNVSFDLTKSIVLKGAYSRTFGQPDLENGNLGILSGNGAYTYSEFDTPDASGYTGEIKVANPGLLPETSNNWDAEIGYYFTKGGKVSVSYYWKNVENKAANISIGNQTEGFNGLMEALGFDPAAYDTFKLTTSTNSTGSQKTSGFEVAVQQNFAFMGEWARGFTAFASYTHKNLGAPILPVPVAIVNPNGTTTDFPLTNLKTINLTANTFAGGGLSFSSGRFSVSVRATYRDKNEKASDRITITHNPGTGAVPVNFIRRFEPAETRVDSSFSYRFSEKLSLFVTARDMFNASRNVIQKDDLGWYPTNTQFQDRREFGISYTLGVRGTF